ncbi:cell wall hydrolase [Aureimonas pseudogalii]|uniref:cell wall hydrolase n=1 Tax=Aureimonas pseudogalii TaxID=1744844 RepID=UPI0035EB121A
MSRRISREGQVRRDSPARRRRPAGVGRASPLLASVLGALLLSAVMPARVAVSDRPAASARLADAASAIETLSALSLHPDFEDDDAPALPRDGTLYVRDAGGRVAAERGTRVVPSRHALVQPRFAAGRLGASLGLLRPGIALGDTEMRTALAGPQPFGATEHVAGNFQVPGAGIGAGIGAGAGAGEAVEVASLEETVPSAAKAPSVAAALTAASADLQTLAAYAPAPKPGASSLFDAVLAPQDGEFIPPIGAGDHSWAATALPPSSFTPKEQTCLANGIYFEARGETELGQAAVAQVILNRVRNPAYPKTICGVVYQNASWRNRCQFSFACDGIKDVIWNKRAFAAAERIADAVTKGETWLPEVGSATHYHATYVRPRWAKTMEQVDKIGLHVFYRTFGGGWR